MDHQKQQSRREFMESSALAAGAGLGALHVATGTGQEPMASEPAPQQEKNALVGDGVTLSQPVVSGSQVDFRIGLARSRTANYPLDSMDFVMMDLERPGGSSRHAHWCTGDLTGRLLEFLSCAEGIDGRSDCRLPDLFERILKQRRASGLFGRYASNPQANTPPEDDFRGGANRLFCGFLRYWGLTGDARALDAAIGVADRIISQQDAWRQHLRATSGRFIEAWVSEPFARLFGITKEQRYLDFVAMINDHLSTCEHPCHAHGFMSTLRGLQVAAILSGDRRWNEKPETNRRIIIDKHLERPDGCTPELFPSSACNEGCSIADWLMLNLNAGRLGDDDSAYEKAERIFWGALAYNQWITGAFVHRALTGNGYGMSRFEEAWWCCVHDGGMAMAEYARHAVSLRENTIRVNLLVPGSFTVPVAGRPHVRLTIATGYPASAEAIIQVENLPADFKLRVRVPKCIDSPVLSESRSADGLRVVLTGKLGHRIEECHGGVMLTYGPLVLAPFTSQSSLWAPPGPAALVVADTTDGDGFLQLGATPLPEWSYFEEGPGSRFGVEGATASVPVKFHDGQILKLRFCPLCYNTSNLSLYETPVVFPEIT